MPGLPIEPSPIVAELENNRSRYQDGKSAWLPAEKIAALLTTGETIDNPEPQTQIPAAINVDEAIGVLSTETCAKLAAAPPIVDFVDKANSGNRDGAMRWIAFAAKAGIVPPDEAAALASLAAKTIPDPTWQPTITGQPPLSHVSIAEVDAALKEVQL